MTEFIANTSPRAGRLRNEDLLTERSTLAIPRLCHNAQADLLRKQQVLGSNPSVGSTPLLRAQEDLLTADRTVFVVASLRAQTC
jgi:hypothetical protein